MWQMGGFRGKIQVGVHLSGWDTTDRVRWQQEGCCGRNMLRKCWEVLQWLYSIHFFFIPEQKKKHPQLKAHQFQFCFWWLLGIISSRMNIDLLLYQQAFNPWERGNKYTMQSKLCKVNYDYYLFTSWEFSGQVGLILEDLWKHVNKWGVDICKWLLIIWSHF